MTPQPLPQTTGPVQHGATQTDLAHAARDASRIRDLEAELRVLRARPAFGLVFEEQPENVVDACRSQLPVVSEVPANRVISPAGTGTGPAHLLIEGDNYHALTALQYTHAGAVDVIYIDPPYNTGSKDFRYNDRFVEKEDAWRHSSWLSFMSRRLGLARKLLKDTGVILISIDDNEYAHLKLLCDQIFGERNLITPLIWDAGRKNDSRFVSNGHEYILVYARSKQALIDADVRWKEPKDGADRVLAEYARLRAQHGDNSAAVEAGVKEWFRTPAGKAVAKGVRMFSNVDDHGVWRKHDASWPGPGGPTYPVYHPSTGRPCTVPANGWRFSEAKMREHIAAGRIVFGSDEGIVPGFKRYLRDYSDEVPTSVFERNRTSAATALKALVGPGAFRYPKDPEVLARWIGIVGGPDAVVLDFFAGSGTTGHAVAQLNAADGGSRQAILVTNNENDICTDVTLPRLRAVLTGQWADGKPHGVAPGELRYYRTDFVRASGHADTARARLAAGAAGLIAIREGAHTPVAVEPGRAAVLTAPGKVVAVWSAPDTLDLQQLHDDGEAVAGHPGIATERVLYCYTPGDSDPDLTGTGPWDTWRVEPIPAHILAALRSQP